MKAKDLVVGAEYAVVDSKNWFEQGLETPKRVLLLSDQPHNAGGMYYTEQNERFVETERFGTVKINAWKSPTGWTGAGALVAYLTDDDDVHHTAVVALSKIRDEYKAVMNEYFAIRARREEAERTRDARLDAAHARSKAVITRIEAIVGKTRLYPTTEEYLNVRVSVLEALLDAAEANRCAPSR